MCEIFDVLHSHDFYAMKPPWVGKLGLLKDLKYLKKQKFKNILIDTNKWSQKAQKNVCPNSKKSSLKLD
jgi:hypothetical protein